MIQIFSPLIGFGFLGLWNPSWVVVRSWVSLLCAWLDWIWLQWQATAGLWIWLHRFIYNYSCFILWEWRPRKTRPVIPCIAFFRHWMIVKKIWTVAKFLSLALTWQKTTRISTIQVDFFRYLMLDKFDCDGWWTRLYDMTNFYRKGVPRGIE